MLPDYKQRYTAVLETYRLQRRGPGSIPREITEGHTYVTVH